MGVTIELRYPLGFGKKSRKNYEEFFRKLESPVPGFIPVREFAENAFSVLIAPFEEEIWGIWKRGSLLVTAKTSSAGPGYHAWLVEALDGLGVKPKSVDDETGYYDSRDFSELQNSMYMWLRQVSGASLEAAQSGNSGIIAINMPFDWTPTGTGRFACCQLGFFEKEFFERSYRANSDGSEFFVWWKQDRDAAFFRNCALNLILVDNIWLPGESDYECNIISTTLACLERAYALDNALGLPAAEWLELAGLAGDGELVKTLKARFGDPGEASLGYRRGKILSKAYNWRIAHDGKMHHEVQESGTHVWWNDAMTIRATSFTVDPKPDAEELLQTVLKQDVGCERIATANPDIHAAIRHGHADELDGSFQDRWLTLMHAAVDGEVLLLLVYYRDRELQQTADKICRSLSR